MNSLTNHLSLRISPIRPDFLARARPEGLDDLNQAVERLTAVGGEPCRDTLRRAQPGESLILASYCPFSRVGPYREYGPVFISAHGAAAECNPTTPTLCDVIDSDYLPETVVLRAYSEDERIVDAQLVSRGQAVDGLQTLLSRDDVSFVLSRFAAYGCYGFRVERA